MHSLVFYFISLGWLPFVCPKQTPAACHLMRFHQPTTTWTNCLINPTRLSGSTWPTQLEPNPTERMGNSNKAPTISSSSDPGSRATNNVRRYNLRLRTNSPGKNEEEQILSEISRRNRQPNNATVAGASEETKDKHRTSWAVDESPTEFHFVDNIPPRIDSNAGKRWGLLRTSVPVVCSVEWIGNGRKKGTKNRRGY